MAFGIRKNSSAFPNCDLQQLFMELVQDNSGRQHRALTVPYQGLPTLTLFAAVS